MYGVASFIMFCCEVSFELKFLSFQSGCVLSSCLRYSRIRPFVTTHAVENQEYGKIRCMHALHRVS